MFCKKCGKEIVEEAVVCVHCGAAVAQSGDKKRITYILLGAFLGCFGVHNFYAGYTGRAIAQLLITLLLGVITGGLAILAVWGWVIFEVCTVKNDKDGKQFA